ncbi:zinc ABC transporter ATP-binding protein ZnuC [Buchnera aphidicola]|uniref:zinc ABC transporter ATP-binding protein ZnuC n=1 Tax=Buchnera aphidicola TaxID=9 RepID=UPI003463DB74
MKTLIKVKNVFIKICNRSILSNISLSLTSNRIITLIGPNGAGKSTLVRTILGLITPDQGLVIRSPNLRVGYVPQKLNFNTSLPISVNQFMQLFQTVNEYKIQKSLKRVNAEHLQNVQLKKLSGGEIQKILLAQALLNSPQLLVLDEPTQGIDIVGQMIFYKLIHQLKKELFCSIFMVSHDLNIVMARTDEVICLNKRICCSGTPENVTKSYEFISMFGNNILQELALYRHHHTL